MTRTTEKEPATHTTGVTHVRHHVLAFLGGLAAITYLDRVAISVTASAIMRDLALTPVGMGMVFSAFTLAYALFEIPTGAWGDRVGTRKVLTRIVVWWSTFTILTGCVVSYAGILAVRFLFGAGEAGAWPNAARTISRWFPARERGTAQGIFFMGAHLSGGLTPMLVTVMLAAMGWRWVFVVFGCVGFFWAAGWYGWFRDEPEQHPSVGAGELEWIEAGRGAARGATAQHSVVRLPWRRIAGNSSIYALCGMYFTQTYGFMFYITWLPTYLEKERGFSSASLGVMAGLPLVLSAVADFTGGVVCDRLTQRLGARGGRASVGVASFLLASVFMLAGAHSRNAVTAAVCISLAAGWSNFLLGAAWASAVDVGAHHAGAVGALMNTAGQLGGIFSPPVVALLVGRWHTWTAPLYLTGALYFVGAISWLFVNPSLTLNEART